MMSKVKKTTVRIATRIAASVIFVCMMIGGIAAAAEAVVIADISSADIIQNTAQKLCICRIYRFQILHYMLICLNIFLYHLILDTLLPPSGIYI